MPIYMRALAKLIVVCILLLPTAAFPAEQGLTVRGVRYSTYPAFTRVVFEIETAAPYVLTRTADGRGLMLAAYDGTLVLKSSLSSIRDSVVSGVELREDAGRTYFLIRLEGAAGEVKDFTLRGPDRIVLDINRGAAPAGVAAPADKPVVVVLDPGHGGKDSGIVTAQGYEKTAMLDLALAVGKILRKNPRLKTVLTREKDQALSLDERAIASNAAAAVIFVSFHAAPGAVARVFIQDPVDDEMRTSRTVSRDFLGFEAGSEQQEMAWGAQQAAHAGESGVLGRRLARRLAGTDAAEALQVPLAGLKAVDAAAVVVEAGMEQDRARIAEAIAGGIEQYVREDR
jgi:N-acetylmuramoyl-L-alanine amidase